MRILNNREIVIGILDVISENKRIKMTIYGQNPYKQFGIKTQTAQRNRLQSMPFLLSINMLNSYGLPVRLR